MPEEERQNLEQMLIKNLIRYFETPARQSLEKHESAIMDVLTYYFQAKK
jgi:hypothetical protein